MEQKRPITGLIGFQCIVGQWSLDLQTFRPAATVPIRINSVSRGSSVVPSSFSEQWLPHVPVQTMDVNLSLSDFCMQE